jgi:hypothetical protein
MTWSRNSVVTGAAIAVLLALAGCSGASSRGEDPVEPAIGTVPKLLASVDLRLPVEDYLTTAEQNDRLGLARLVLIRRCMARFGFEYNIKPVPTSGYGPRSLTDRRYGITDAELARTFGYGLGPRDPALLVRPDKPQIGPDGENVLSGQGRSVVKELPVPDGGCLGEAERAFQQSVPSGADTTKGTQLQFRSFEESKGDRRVRAVFAEWSTCMSELGYRYTDPLAAAADPAFIGPVTPEQIAVATADIKCKDRTNLVGIWFSVESAYQRRQIDSDRAGFAIARQAIAARDRAAAVVVQ